MPQVVLKVKVPGWLKPGLSMTAEKFQELSDHAASWRALSPVLRKLGEVDLMRVVCIELQGARRPEIISRPLNRLNRLRTGREMEELRKMYPGVGVRNGRRV